jgi:hypothetical protein
MRWSVASQGGHQSESSATGGDHDREKPRADGARRYGPALERTCQFVLWLVPTLDKFPRSQRFLLGDRIEAAAQ